MHSLYPASSDPIASRFAGLQRWLSLNMRMQGYFLAVVGIVVLARLYLIENSAALLRSTILFSIGTIASGIFLWMSLSVLAKSAELGSVSAGVKFLRETALNRNNAKLSVSAALGAALLMNSFAHFKSSIGGFRDYKLDPFFAHLDRSVHFGIDPWRITEMAFGYGPATWVIDNLYYLWFFAVFLPLGAAIVSPPSPLRHRFLISYALVWAGLGIVIATLCASGGPIFYDRLVGGISSFTPLVDALIGVDAEFGLKTMAVREVLWDTFAKGASTTISGISAMPSVHNAMCVLLVLAARHISRRLTILAAIFAMIIFVGSVHLGWHYAIDAYASMLAVPVIWKVAGWLAAERAVSVQVC